MKTSKGNLFDQKADVICITTNGYYTYQGEAIMGKGVAGQAVSKWPELKRKLGYMLQVHGTHVFIILKKSKVNKRPYLIVNFPTKPKSGKSNGLNVVRHLRRVPAFKKGKRVPGWALKSSLEIIERSARELVELVKEHDWEKIILPRPGCGAGELEWKDVRAVLKPILRGNKYVVVG